MNKSIGLPTLTKPVPISEPDINTYTFNHTLDIYDTNGNITSKKEAIIVGFEVTDFYELEIWLTNLLRYVRDLQSVINTYESYSKELETSRSFTNE